MYNTRLLYYTSFITGLISVKHLESNRRKRAPMKTAVITDSASYLTKEQAQKYNITVLPITVIFGMDQYAEGVDISATEFLTKLATTEKLPTTAQVTMGQMQEAFDELSAAGYEEVICVNLSSGITTFYENLVAYSRDVTNIKVYPFDSKIASAGEADLALLAGKMATEGKNANEIIPRLEQLRDSIKVDLVVDNIGHLLRTGRISNTSAFIGNMLRIKPILTFDHDGKIVPLAKEHTMRQAFNKVLATMDDSILEFTTPVRISIVDANNPKTKASWTATIQEHFPNAIVETNQIGPSISVHTGEKAMGVLWATDWQYLSEL